MHAKHRGIVTSPSRKKQRQLNCIAFRFVLIIYTYKEELRNRQNHFIDRQTFSFRRLVRHRIGTRPEKSRQKYLAYIRGNKDKSSAEEEYQNTMKNNDWQTSRIEHDAVCKGSLLTSCPTIWSSSSSSRTILIKKVDQQSFLQHDI